MDNEEPKQESSYFPRSYGSGIRDGRPKEESESFAGNEPPAEEKGETASEAGAFLESSVEEELPEAVAEANLGSSSDTEDEPERFEAQEPPTVDPAEGRVSPIAGLNASHRSQPETAAHEVFAKIAGVRFNYAGKIYHFDAGDLELAAGDWVIVKTEKGTGLGHVAVGPVECELSLPEAEGLRRIVRKAGKVDFDQQARCVQREEQAKSYCMEQIDELSLPMKLVDVECFFDGGKYVFYFTAEGRVDFRELVKRLVARFPVRIEMRQIGVRHEAKMTGGLGCCGQELCCARFLTDFRPVSVRMAKNQNLSLNPTKISGVCGRLMCCLAYENEIYEEFKKGVPRVGKAVSTPKGEGVVLKHNPLTRSVLVKLQDETTVELTKEDLLQSAGFQTNEKDSDIADEEAMLVDPSEAAYEEECGEEDTSP
jgi:cell fate regulator YaaT (PSP1 superfamily)